MRIRIVDLDVTPEEVASTPELRRLLVHLAEPGSPLAQVHRDAAPGAIPPLLEKLLDARGPGGVIRQTLNEFLAGVLVWDGVDARVGASRMNKQNPANVIRLHRRGSGVGAFVYVELPAARLKFRLPSGHDLRGLDHAWARDVQPTAPYGVAMPLTPASLAEAMDLARQAFERASTAGPATDGAAPTPPKDALEAG
jgi:hypothetical protein